MVVLTLKEQIKAVKNSDMEPLNKEAVLQSLKVIATNNGKNDNSIIARLDKEDARVFIRYLDLKYKQQQIKEANEG